MHIKILQWRSLKTRVSLLTLAIFLISIWSLAFYSTHMLREDMERLLGDQQFSTVTFIAEGVTEELEKRIKSLESIASLVSPAMQQGDTATVQALLPQRPIFQTLFNGGSFVTGIDGIAIADVPFLAGRIGINYADRDFMPAVLKEGKTMISRPFMGKALKAPVFAMAVPVRDTEGKVIGALVGGTDLSKPNFLDKIGDNRYGKTGGYVLMAPQHKLIVTATDKSRIMQPTPAPGINPLLDRYIQGFEGSGVVVDSHGVEMLSSAKQIPLAGWFLAARMPTAEAFAPIHAMQRRMVLITFFMTLLAGGLTWRMLRRQLAPMLAAVKILDTQSDSNLPLQPLPITRQDEVGDLIGGFNRLLETLAQREEALTETKELFTLLMRHSPIYTYIKEVTSTGSRVLQASENFQEMVGIPGSKMTGKMMTELFPAEFAAKINADDQAVVSKGEVLKIDEELNGRSYTTIKFPLMLREKILLAGYTIDITERKQAQEENSKLEGQLQQAQKMEAIGQLAGGVAHDFNNMLGVILGYAELALYQLDPTHPLFKNLQEIRKAASRSADITRQLLAFARKQTIAPKVLDLNETVESMLKMMRRLIGEDINLAWLPGAGLWPIKMDASQIDQILANLCVNARDAIAGVGKMSIETGNGTLDREYCAVHTGCNPGEYVSISVSDNGHGMDKETLSHIFEPFFTTKGVGEGTGLGLATVYGAVKQNNGFINAYSEPGQGTTFTIYLPRYVGEAELTGVEKTAEPAVGGHETILLVEDEPTILEMTTTMLQGLGYTVLAASTPVEAIRLASDFTDEIHLLTTDVIMPEMNGRDLAQQLFVSQPGMKCLFMSGYSADIIARQGMLHEGVCFIQKPFSIQNLAAKVRQALNRAGTFSEQEKSTTNTLSPYSA